MSEKKEIDELDMNVLASAYEVREANPEFSKNYMNFPKYSKEAPFTDPVIRCAACRKLVRVDFLRVSGACPCGNRRMIEVRSLDPVEHGKLQIEFPDFAEVFTVRYDDTKGFV